MKRFEFISTLKKYIESKDVYFFYGSAGYRNALTDSYDFKPHKKIFVCDFTFKVTVENGVVQKITYSGGVMFGQKCESKTHANLDETPMQKYDLRLEKLYKILTNLIIDFACKNNLQVSDMDGRFEINKDDVNIDYVMYNVSFTTN